MLCQHWSVVVVDVPAGMMGEAHDMLSRAGIGFPQHMLGVQGQQ